MDLAQLPENAEVAIQTGKTVYLGRVMGREGNVLHVDAPGAHATWRILCFHVTGPKAGKSVVGDYTLHPPGGAHEKAADTAADLILAEERQYRRLMADMETRLVAAATCETGRGIETPPPGQMRLPYSDSGYEPDGEGG